MDTTQIKKLLDKYAQDKCSDQEKRTVEAWLDKMNSSDERKHNEQLIKSNLDLVQQRIADRISTPQQPVRNNKVWMRVAACFAFIALAAAMILLFMDPRSNKIQQQIAANRSNGFHQEVKDGWMILATDKGTTKTIQLPDGSNISLNASSKVRYPVAFAPSKRAVYLDEGEALFTVAKDQQRPFTVYTPQFATTALGTSFNIRSYSNEHKVSISLINGKIKVVDLLKKTNAHINKILQPNQQLVLNKETMVTSDQNFKDQQLITGWKEGILAFQDANMEEVLNSIENRFGVKIEVHGSTKTRWSYTGTFKDENLQEVLQTICITEGITYKIINNKIILNN